MNEDVPFEPLLLAFSSSWGRNEKMYVRIMAKSY